MFVGQQGEGCADAEERRHAGMPNSTNEDRIMTVRFAYSHVRITTVEVDTQPSRLSDTPRAGTPSQKAG